MNELNEQQVEWLGDGRCIQCGRAEEDCFESICFDCQMKSSEADHSDRDE